MALGEPAGKRDVVCHLFIPLSVDYWRARCQDSHLHIFGCTQGGTRNDLSSKFQPPSLPIIQVQTIESIIHVGAN